MIQAIAIGINHKDFWIMNPRLIYLYGEAYQLQQKQQDIMNWYNGRYFLSALRVALSGFSKNSKEKYMEKPIFEQLEEEENRQNQTRNEYKGLSDKDKEKLEL